MVDWNERYRQGEHTSDEPHPLVVQFAPQFTPGRALDVACGAGRHAIWLAEHGWRVTAVDSSKVAVEILQQRAAGKHVNARTWTVGPTLINVDARVADLERHEFEIEPNAYDLIVMCNYLQRDLFKPMKEGTRVGGVAIAVIAMIDDDPEIKPMNPAYLLNPGELRREFEDWRPFWYFEGKSGRGHRRATAEIVAQRIS